MTIRQLTTTLPNAFPNFQINQTTSFQVAAPVVQPPFKAKKAGTNGSHCFMILDESGSMSGLVKDTIGGVNTFIEKQKEDADDTKLTIVKFEGRNIVTSIDGIDVREIETFNDYSPKGGTNLLDAVGFVIEKINNMLDGMKKKDRPSIFIQIVTDGEENSSQKYTKDRIKNMVQIVGKADWIVTYVGANVDAFSEAASLGIHSSATSNYKTSNISETFGAMASSTSRMKSLRSVGTSAMNMYATNMVYTADEKKDMEK